ncbi:MAG: MFS transporter [Leptolyngbya sp. SIO4C5]|uniref:MFS transporter n=1 Tax=Sphaerothrix gracilis TaxID=3151835 RepID=UPI0013BEF3D3|nr:MFS transporter [Leptolyngbya sp. SIO4C5]
MGSPSLEGTAQPITEKLDLTTRLAYGTGEIAGAIPSSTTALFLIFFLTNVAGLSPILAGSAMFLGKVWDALSDPVIGWLSDHTQSRLGRRYPWMLGGAIPLAIACILCWRVPATTSQWGLFAYYVAASILAYSGFTCVMLPFSALAAELTQGYDERITLISFKSAFSIGGSIFALAMAQILFTQIAEPERQYQLLGLGSAVLVILAVLGCVAGTYKRYRLVQKYRPQMATATTLPLWQQVRIAASNRPFLWVAGLYLFSWTGVQISVVVLLYFVVDWMGLSKSHFVWMALVVQATAVAATFLWNWIGRHSDKRTLYFLGAPFIVVAQIGLFVIQPGQIGWMYGLGVLAGIGTATVYLVPWSMLPDVVDFDELNTGQRREGLFYSSVVFLQKMGIALAIFITSQVLAWAGYIATSADEAAVIQPDSALWTIRIIIGPISAIAIAVGLIFAYYYPITRQVHTEILLQLRER